MRAARGCHPRHDAIVSRHRVARVAFGIDCVEHGPMQRLRQRCNKAVAPREHPERGGIVHPRPWRHAPLPVRARPGAVEVAEEVMQHTEGTDETLVLSFII